MAVRVPDALRRSPASLGCCVVVLGIHLLVTGAGGAGFANHCYETLGLSRGGFLSGKPWQILSYGWLHGSWWHAGLNALLVLALGSRIERMLGGRAMMLALVGGVLGGGLGHLLIGSGLLVGLSGGCVALLLLLTTLSPQSRMFPVPVSGKSLGWGIMLAALLLAAADPALGLPGVSMAGRWLVRHGMASWFLVGHACHFGGGLAGWLYGRWWLRSRVTLDDLRRARARREARPQGAADSVPPCP